MDFIKLCKISNKEIQLKLGRPFYNEKDQRTYFLAIIDGFSKFPSPKYLIEQKHRIF